MRHARCSVSRMVFRYRREENVHYPENGIIGSRRILRGRYSMITTEEAMICTYSLRKFGQKPADWFMNWTV